MHDRMKDRVDFIGIAAPRCGTTWVSKCLAEHPQVFVPESKELFFFNKAHNFKKGKEHYAQHFAGAKEDNVCGEFTPFYFADSECAERIYGMFPEVKLVVLLRDPVERIVSHHAYRVHKGLEKYRDLSEALRHDPQYVALSMYGKRLRPFLRRFPAEHICIVYLEDGAEEVCGTLYAFLGVRSDFVPRSLHMNVNRTATKQYHLRSLNRLVLLRKRLKESWFGRLLVAALTLVGGKRIVQKLEQLNRSKRVKQMTIVKDETRKELKELLHDDITELSEYVKRDLHEVWF